MSIFSVRGIENYQLSTVGQHLRGRSARPTVLTFAKKMLFCLVTQRFDLIECNNKKLCVLSKLERLKPLAVISQSGKLTQPLSSNFVVASFLSWR